VLKELLLSGLVIPFALKKRERAPLLIDREHAVDVAPMPTSVAPTIGTDGTDAKWPELSAIEAAKVFYLEMQQHAAGEAVQMRWVRHSYDVLAKQRGWPVLSDKVLSQHLVSFGCKRKKIDLRKSGNGRPTVFEFPLETTAQKRRRKK
jgi:hypothetical protein